ncbi:MAG: hypothetical protein EBT95_05800, partial [Verrucomicrobia bacterium]|nr:hypothetical protein [Verrucomicrobiota bacterium]
MGDPTIIKEGIWFYMYGSGSGIPGVRSTNLVNWEALPRVLPNNDTPTWSPITPIATTNAGNEIWAPQITKYGSTYRMYYSHSTIGSQRSVIGLATASTLDPTSGSYGWTDQGLVLDSRGETATPLASRIHGITNTTSNSITVLTITNESGALRTNVLSPGQSYSFTNYSFDVPGSWFRYGDATSNGYATNWYATPALTNTPYNAIDPKMHVEVAGENGAGGNNVNKNWLFWGSYWSGIFVTSLNRTTGKSPALGKYQLASRGQTNGPGPGIEGPTVVWRNGYYYLFVSYDVYESYNVRVGRSTNLIGPYVDRQGRSMTNGYATPLLAPYGKWRNTGHNDVLLGQSTGYDLFVSHIWTKDFIRALQVRPLFWAVTALPGSWAHQTGWTNTISINYASNGTFSTSAGSSGTWQTNSGRLTLNWSGGLAQELTLHPDGNSYVGRAADDSDIRGWRVPVTPAGANGSYNLTSRWQGGVIPGTADAAIVEDDGTLSMSNTDPDWSVLDIRIGSSMGSLGAMSQTGGKVTQGGWMRVGIHGTGSLDQSGGTNQIAGFLNVGENRGSSGLVNLRGTGTLSCGDLAVGWAHSSSKGEVLMQQGSFNVSAATFIGLEGTGTLSVAGGTMNVTGNGWGAFRIGNWPNTNSMGNGTVNLLGGTVNANKTTTVGGFGNGTLNISGGSWNQSAGNLYVGEKVDSTYLGRGEVNQSGGILSSWYVFLQQGTYNLNGGTLSVAGVGDGATNAN